MRRVTARPPRSASRCYALVRLKAYDALAAVALDPLGQPRTRWWPVAYAFQRMEDPRALPALLTLVRDPHPYTRAFAAKGLGAMGNASVPLAGAALLPLVEGADKGVAVEAIRSLARLHDRRRHRDADQGDQRPSRRSDPAARGGHRARRRRRRARVRHADRSAGRSQLRRFVPPRSGRSRAAGSREFRDRAVRPGRRSALERAGGAGVGAGFDAGRNRRRPRSAGCFRIPTPESFPRCWKRWRSRRLPTRRRS